MTIWPPRPEILRRPAFRALAESLIRAIETGELTPGHRLPPHRKLANELGLSVQTVTRAFELVAQCGLIRGETGRGTYVDHRQKEPEQPFIAERGAEMIDLSMLKPVALADQPERLRHTLATLDPSTCSIYSFRPSVALDRQKRSAVKWLHECGVDANPTNILITNGATPGMTVALMTALAPGQKMASEAIGHHTLGPLANYLGLGLVPVAIDEQGIIPDALDQACDRHGDIRAIYLLPNGAGPTAALMHNSRRSEIVAIARKRDLKIIENDALAPLIKADVTPITMLAAERTFYIGSMTKSVLPGLRIGFLVVPDRLVASAANRQLAANWMATPLMADIASRWIEDGTASEFAQAQRLALAKRQKLAATLLAASEPKFQPNGMHIWLSMKGGWQADDLVSQGRLHGVAIAPGSVFSLDPDIQINAVRLCTGGVELAALERGLSIVARLLMGEAEPALLAN